MLSSCGWDGTTVRPRSWLHTMLGTLSIRRRDNRSRETSVASGGPSGKARATTSVQTGQELNGSPQPHRWSSVNPRSQM